MVKFKIPNNTDIRDERWLEQYYKLVAYKKKYGYTRVPSKDSNNAELSIWVHHQRNRQNNLASWRVELLLKIGFEFSLRPHAKKSTLIVKENPALKKVVEKAIKNKTIVTTEDIEDFSLLDYQWYYRALQFRQYRLSHKIIPINQVKKDFPELGNWIGRQKRDREKLSKQKRAVLVRLGFNFTLSPVIQKRRDWDKMFDRLLKYKQKYGHPNVLQTEGVLGIWLYSQRRIFSKGTMRPDKVKKLKALGVLFGEELIKWINQNKKNERWNQYYQQYRDLIAEDMGKLVKLHKTHTALWKWVRRQHLDNQQGIIDKERKIKLRSIGFKFQK